MPAHEKTQTIIVPVTAAVTTHADLTTKWYKAVVVAADRLAGAEEVDIYTKTNGRYVPFVMPDGTTPAKLTATAPSLELAGGPIYGFQKDATAQTCGVFAHFSLGNKRR
jgi:hypothetical protein